jgi:urea carboxylase
MGIHKCGSSKEVLEAFSIAVSQGQKNFGNGDVFVEKYIESAKHIEVQVFGDGAGHVVALGDRECSVQRRHQKVIEECPSPYLDGPLREEMMAAAVRLCAAAKYRSAGTVEFLLDAKTRKFYFLEVNTRLQVEVWHMRTLIRTKMCAKVAALSLAVQTAWVGKLVCQLVRSRLML